MLWCSVSADILANSRPSINKDNDYDDDICVAELLQNCFIFIKTKVICYKSVTGWLFSAFYTITLGK